MVKGRRSWRDDEVDVGRIVLSAESIYQSEIPYGHHRKTTIRDKKRDYHQPSVHLHPPTKSPLPFHPNNPGSKTLTNNRTKANPKQKTNGPARSASSMISGAGRFSGLRTVSDLARMWEGLIPISVYDFRGWGVVKGERRRWWWMAMRRMMLQQDCRWWVR